MPRLVRFTSTLFKLKLAQRSSQIWFNYLLQYSILGKSYSVFYKREFDTTLDADLKDFLASRNRSLAKKFFTVRLWNSFEVFCLLFFPVSPLERYFFSRFSVKEFLFWKLAKPHLPAHLFSEKRDEQWKKKTDKSAIFILSYFIIFPF